MANTPETVGARAAPPTTLRLGGGSVGFNWLPILLAERRGLFAREGLTLDIRRLGTVDRATAAVKSGELDIAITPPEGAIRDFAAGGGLRVVAGNVNRLPLTLIANPRFHRIEELKGARLGTSSLTEGTALYTMEVLRRHGLAYPGDYEFSVVGVHPARWKALQEGTIDAAVQLIPLNFVAIDAGYANLGEVTDYIPEIVFTGWVVDDTWARGHRHELVAAIRIVMTATGWLDDPANDDELLEIVSELSQADPTYSRRTLDYIRQKAVFAHRLSIPAAAFSKSLELMQKAGLADQTLMRQAHGVIDDRYRQEALG